MKWVLPDKAGLHVAAAALRRDEVVAYPTETVYGLAVNPFSPAALEKLFRIKARDNANPILLIVANPEMVLFAAKHVGPTAERCMQHFWPGPLSLLFDKSDQLPEVLLGGREKVCIRCPGHAVARQLCQVWGGPLTSTSANLSGMPPARSVKDAAMEGVSVVIDGGDLGHMAPSTVYDPDENRILREGPITKAMIEHVLAGGPAAC